MKHVTFGTVISIVVLASLSSAAATPVDGEAVAVLKRAWRAQWFKGRAVTAPRAAPGHAPENAIEPADGVETFVSSLRFDRLEEMDRAGLGSGKVKVQPWSGDYWPVSGGVLARRYADPEFPSGSWKENSAYVLSRLNSSSVETLSPAEKYDLLVGDAAFSLTRAMLNQGKHLADASGNVESWMGICHGWAPASYLVPRPESRIEVLAADGRTRIPFLPSDIKGLISLLWAEGHYRTVLAGERCNTQGPPERECLDENPGAWHLLVTQQLGVAHEGFVFDATYDYQVWNQPVISYQVSYFNPRTRASAATLAGASVRLAEFPDDRFHAWRSPQAVTVVGVNMELTYGSETSASTAIRDSAEDDLTQTARYAYDLELDANGRIIGGEWYQRAHPDFLWKPARGTRPRADGDRWLDRNDPTASWDGTGPVPASWIKAAALSSPRGMPLAHVVEALDALAQLGR